MAVAIPLALVALAAAAVVVVVSVAILKAGEVFIKAVIAEYNYHFPTGHVEMRPYPTPPKPATQGQKDRPPGQPIPPFPIPVPTVKPVANTGAQVHEGTENNKNNDCVEELKKYPVHAYRDRNKAPYKRYDHQSHHVFQNALFEDKNGNFPSSLGPPPCKTYTKHSAPCIPLEGGTKDEESPHGIVSALQQTHGANARRRDGPHTYGAAKKDVVEQLKAGSLTEKEIICVMIAVEAKIKELCPEINDNTVLRTPG